MTVISLTIEEGWPIIEEAVSKLVSKHELTLDECIHYYTAVYDMCNHRNPSQQKMIYDKYADMLNGYINEVPL